MYVKFSPSTCIRCS